jgi:ATP-dependent exoDNAse (exonuclease V) beta subunit
MLNSNLLYVGLTRMKKRCYHLGTLSSVNQAIGKKANLTRHTFMQQLLLNMKEDEYMTHEIPVEIIGDVQENIDSQVDNDLPWYTDEELEQMSKDLF